MKAIDLLQKINWFLKPISDLILFLFTTKTGIFILILLLVASIYLVMYNRIKERKLLYEAATDDNKLPWRDFWLIFSDELGKIIAKLIANITVILVVLFLMLAIVGMSASFTSVNNFVINQKKTKELKIALKNLSKEYKVAKVEVLNYNLRYDSTKLKVSFYDYAKNGLVPKEQIIKLPGHNIYFVTFVMNFKYSEIENGDKINIAIPYLIYSEKQTQPQGIKLQLRDSTGIPFIFHRNSDDLYGMNKSSYNESVREIVSYMNDPKLAKQAGVVSSYDSSPHYVKALRKGQIFYIYVEQVGGLIIKQEENWNN